MLPPDSIVFSFLVCSLALAMAALSFSEVPVRLWPGTGAVLHLEAFAAGSGNWVGGFTVVTIGVEFWVVGVSAASVKAGMTEMVWLCCPD